MAHNHTYSQLDLSTVKVNGKDWDFTSDWDHSRSSGAYVSQAILSGKLDEKCNLPRLTQEQIAEIVKKLRAGKEASDPKVQWTDREILLLIHLVLLLGYPNDADKTFLKERIDEGDFTFEHK